MNKIVFTIILTALSITQAAIPQVHWQEYSQALETAKKHEMIVFVNIYAEWCVPCKVMDKTTYRDSAVVHILNTYFLPVKINAESEDIISCNNWPRPTDKCVKENWKLKGVPTIALIGPAGNYILSISQALTPEQMKLILQDFQNNRKTLLQSEPQQVK
ncbi:MAG: DUF255 domain-containing protein [Fibrobacter sp.]|nr:DUF255 domain-containing protein [Fibrobacter sp.]